tara:strand:+ start:220 stop:348 length:129 start_codon:yes stop_codon:yes gene_type:complete
MTLKEIDNIDFEKGDGLVPVIVKIQTQKMYLPWHIQTKNHWN